MFFFLVLGPGLNSGHDSLGKGDGRSNMCAPQDGGQNYEKNAVA